MSLITENILVPLPGFALPMTALICGFIFNTLGASGVTGFNIWSLFVAFIGAVVLLGILRMLGGRSSTAV